VDGCILMFYYWSHLRGEGGEEVEKVQDAKLNWIKLDRKSYRIFVKTLIFEEKIQKVNFKP